MQPLQYDVRCPAAKENSITHAAAAPSNLDAAITMRFAKTELQSTIERRATASEIAAPKLDGSRRQSKSHQRQNWEILLTNHYRSRDAATPIRCASSCKRQTYYAGSPRAKQPWRSHYNARPPSNSDGSLGCEHLLAVRSLGCEISWLWDFLAVRFLCCEISWLWDLSAVRSLGPWDLLAVMSLGCEIPWRWDLLAVRSLGCGE